MSTTCLNITPNVVSQRCEFNPKEFVGALVSLDLNYKLDVTADKTAINALIASGKLFVIKGFNGVVESEMTGVQVATTGYGYKRVTTSRSTGDITFDYPWSLCNKKELEKLTGVKIAVYFFDVSGRVFGKEVIENGDKYLKGNVSQFVVDGGIPIVTNPAEYVPKPMRWMSDKWDVDAYFELPFDYDELDGVSQLTATVSNAEVGYFYIEFRTDCNGLPIFGLQSFIEVRDYTNAVVATTATASGTGYRVEGAGLIAGKYAVNVTPAIVEDANGQLYAALTLDALLVIVS